MVQCIAVLMVLLSALTLHEVASETNFYDLLNIKKDADNREIRKAFKQLALKMHPDKNPVSYDLIITCGNVIHILLPVIYFSLMTKKSVNTVEFC